jgi:tetratricopeptide (TPR) repeat protein
LLLIALWLGGAAALAAAHLRAWHHCRAAQAALTRYHFDEARNHLAIPLRAWPNSWRVHLLASRAARLAGDSGEAERHLDRCRELQAAESPDVLLEWALLHASSGDITPVEESLWNQMRQGSPEAPLIRGALVEGYVRLYRLADAQACLEDWLSRAPDDTQALFLQGCFWQQVQRPQMALASYRRVMELDPERDDARWRLAQCLVQTSDPGEAIGHLEYLHRRHPENQEMAVELARGLFKEARLAEARRLLDIVLAEQPDCVPALVERSRLALSEGDPAGSEKWLRRAVTQNARDSQALRLLSACLLQQGRRDEAERLRDQLAERDDDAKRVAEICLRELGERPNDPALQCELGKRLLRMGYPEAGRAWLLRAVSTDPSYAPARDALTASGQGLTDTPNRR